MRVLRDIVKWRDGEGNNNGCRANRQVRKSGKKGRNTDVDGELNDKKKLDKAKERACQTNAKKLSGMPVDLTETTFARAR